VERLFDGHQAPVSLMSAMMRMLMDPPCSQTNFSPWSISRDVKPLPPSQLSFFSFFPVVRPFGDPMIWLYHSWNAPSSKPFQIEAAGSNPSLPTKAQTGSCRYDDTCSTHDICPSPPPLLSLGPQNVLRVNDHFSSFWFPFPLGGSFPLGAIAPFYYRGVPLLCTGWRTSRPFNREGQTGEAWPTLLQVPAPLHPCYVGGTNVYLVWLVPSPPSRPGASTSNPAGRRSDCSFFSFPTLPPVSSTPPPASRSSSPVVCLLPLSTGFFSFALLITVVQTPVI